MKKSLRTQIKADIDYLVKRFNITREVAEDAYIENHRNLYDTIGVFVMVYQMKFL